MLRILIAGALAALAAVAVGPTPQYPAKPITVIVAYPAGGNNDLRARQLAIPVAEILGKQLIVDNRPGAAGNIGHAALAKAAADGYTLGIGAMGPLGLTRALYPDMPCDAKSFEPIVLIERAPLVLVTRADKPYKSVAEVVAAAKEKPGTIAIGNAGTGGAHHLAATALAQTAGVQFIQVPYKGGGPAATALLGGEIERMFEQTYAALPPIRAGKTRALAVAGEKLLPSLLDVPTMAELGYPQATISNWLRLIAPKGTPRAVVIKLNDAFNRALAMPEIREKIVGPGNEVGGGTPEAFAEFVAKEADRWPRMIKAAGIKVE